MRKVLNFVKGKREDKKDASLSLNVANISVEITDPAGVTTPSDDYDFVGTTQQCTDYEVDLSGKDKSITKLHKASWVGNLEKVKTHLKKIDVNVVDASNRTPLHLAAAQGHTHVVWFLLSNKAQMDIIDAGGKTSLLKAVEGGYKEIVSNMLEKGADLNLKDADSNTALHIATKLGYYDIATVLLKNGSNFESANKKGEYALHIATTGEHMDLVELLLRYGAAVNVIDGDARTPLMLAARCGNAPLVELFLEYGAKRDMVDNSSFTAQDYAINKGYGDLAALLVTASMERIEEEEDKLDDTETDTSPQHLDKQKSVSSGSLVPVIGSNVDGSDGPDPAEDGDSWNDSQLSESNKETKIPPSKLKTFLPPSSDDEESDVQSPAKEEKNVHDSPNSCVIPPPLKPPRSWDLIQAGMIDDNTGSEVKRCSLTALGTLRSRRESFNDSTKSDLESPMSLKDGVDTKDLEKGDVVTSKTTPSSKVAETTVLKRDKSDLSAVESDWDSDESLPLDKSGGTGSTDKVQLSPKPHHQISVDVHQEPTDDDDLPAPPSPSQLVVPEETTGFLKVAIQSAPGSGAVSPEPVSEKRARMLLMQNQQSVELTLTDDRTEDKSDHSEGSPSALPKDGEVENSEQPGSPSVTGTLGREGTMLGYDEMWESNAAFAPSSPTSVNQEATLPTSHSLPRIDERIETSEGEQSPSSQIIIDLNVPKITEISRDMDIVRSPIGKSICTIPPPVPLAVVGKSEEVEDLTKKVQDSKFSAKRHVRNKSIFQLPPQGEPEPQLEPSSIPQFHLPSTQALHDQIINRQLECYDIAIRDLAASSPSKQESPGTENINPLTIQALKSSEAVDSDSFVDKGHRIMPDLLAGSKVAALAAAFGNETNQNKQSVKPERDGELPAEAKGGEDDEEYDDVESDGIETSLKLEQGSMEKPLRKKRKSLLAMQKLEPTASQGSQGSQSMEKNVDVSSSDSDEEPAYWGSAGISKVLRQSTVIKKGNDVDPTNTTSPGSLSLEDIEHTSTSGSSNEDVTAPVEDVGGSSSILDAVQTSGKDAKLSIADSDVESCASQTDGTPSHSSVKNHESLLKHHLQVVTEERGRLAETTVELGEKTERLMYELADAREAARARDEVISMLQIQLQRLEESHIKGLEEVQTHRFHLDSRDQELRHLEEVCQKALEETVHLKEIIRLKDKEVANLTLMRASRDEEAQMQSIARDKDKEMTINELRIHLKYVEQERDRLKETLVTMEHQQASLQARTEALVEENARTGAQLSNDLRNAQEETNKWRNLYESCLLKLEAMDSTQVKVLLDAKSSESDAAQAYQKEILSAVERLEKEKEADRQIWQAKIKDEVANAVHVLKSEYEKVEDTLRKHNATLEAMVEKLEINHDIAVKRQESLENQLRSAQNELQKNNRDTSELSQLQLEFSRIKHQAVTDQNKLKTLESELEVKDQTFADLRKTLEIVRQEKNELAALLSGMHQRQDNHESDSQDRYALESTGELDKAGQTKGAEWTSTDDYSKIINNLLRENGDLKSKIDQLNMHLRHLQIEHSATIEQLHLEKSRTGTVKILENQSMTANKAIQELENSFRQEKEELLKQVTELRMKLQKRDSSPSSASLCNASAMTDQVRWNQSGLMGVVQKQKEEIEGLKEKCAKLRSSSKSPSPSPSNVPPEIKPRPGKPSPKSPRATPDTIDLLKSTKKEDVEQLNEQSKGFLQPYICKRCSSPFSPNKRFVGVAHKHSSTETQTIEGCESPAHTSKCSSPRHSWNQKTGTNIEQELQAQAEKCLKHQQMIAGLKSELQLLRGGNGDYQINLQKQVSDLQQKIKDEMAMRSCLELQMNKMKYEVQEKGQVERELEKLKGRLEREFVSRRELDHLKTRARADETAELSTKLAQVNKLLLQQAHGGQAKESVEAQIHKEYEETRQYLVSELAKVQASLQAKESEERELKIKCEKLSRECDKKNEHRRKMLIEKSYNLGQQFMKEKYSGGSEQKPASSFVSDQILMKNQPPKESTTPLENPYSALLRKEVKKSAEKYKTPEPIPDISSGVKSEEHMVYLKKKYCLP